MAKSNNIKSMTDARMIEIIDEAMVEFKGSMNVLESAIGSLVLGRAFGWHVLRLVHSGRTFKHYEEILGIKFREELPDRTPQSKRVNGIRLADAVGKFWQAIASGTVTTKEASILQ